LGAELQPSMRLPHAEQKGARSGRLVRQ